MRSKRISKEQRSMQCAAFTEPPRCMTATFGSFSGALQTSSLACRLIMLQPSTGTRTGSALTQPWRARPLEGPSAWRDWSGQRRSVRPTLPGRPLYSEEGASGERLICPPALPPPISHQPWVPQLVGMHAREALYLPRWPGSGPRA